MHKMLSYSQENKNHKNSINMQKYTLCCRNVAYKTQFWYKNPCLVNKLTEIALLVICYCIQDRCNKFTCNNNCVYVQLNNKYHIFQRHTVKYTN